MTRGLLLASAAGLLAAGGTAGADELPEANFIARRGDNPLFVHDRAVSISDRPQPGYDPIRRPLGGYLLLVEADAALGYDDNIFASDDYERSDAIAHGTVSADLRSDWDANLVHAFVAADTDQYLSHGDQSVGRFAAGANGALDLPDGISLQLGGDVSRRDKSRLLDRSTTVTLRPVLFDQYHAFGGATYAPAALRVSVWGDVSGVRYKTHSPPTLSGAPVFYVDRDVYAVNARAEYAVTPSWAFGVSGQGFKRDFSERPGLSTRDADGYEILATVDFERDALARGRLSIGYLHTNFTSPSFRDISALGFHAEVNYFPTQLIDVTLTADRSVDDTPVANGGGVLVTSAEGRVDYELLRNLRLHAAGGYAREDYRGIDLSYNRGHLGAGADYRLNNRFGITGSFDHYGRSASGSAPARTYTDNRVLIGASHQF